MNETCEAEILMEDGVEVYALLLPGFTGGLPVCGKPAVEKQDFMGHPDFDKKFPPRRLCAEHWDQFTKLMAEARAKRKAEELER